MKTSYKAAVSAAALSLCIFAPSAALAQSSPPTVPLVPSGWLTAFPTIVQTGTKPTLNWAINYPSIVEDYIDITPPSTVKTTEILDCEVRILGNGVTVSGSGISGFQWVNAEATLKFNSGSYTRIFYGTNLNVNPSTVVWSRTNMAKNSFLRFGGRYFYNNQWGPTFTTESGTQNVRSLVNGQIPPSNIPDYGAPSLESFLRPYLGADGRVKIGPMDVIVFMELTHTDAQMSSNGYDLQDMVLLVTFKTRTVTSPAVTNINGVNSETPGGFINLDLP